MKDEKIQEEDEPGWPLIHPSSFLLHPFFYRWLNSVLAKSAWHSAVHVERRFCFWP
jgi:hypothetical protein